MRRRQSLLDGGWKAVNYVLDTRGEIGIDSRDQRDTPPSAQAGNARVRWRSTCKR
jgi:hypothetical protein